MPDIMAMVKANICRALPPNNEDFDPEEDEPILENSWPHLQVGGRTEREGEGKAPFDSTLAHASSVLFGYERAPKFSWAFEFACHESFYRPLCHQVTVIS